MSPIAFSSAEEIFDIQARRWGKGSFGKYASRCKTRGWRDLEDRLNDEMGDAMHHGIDLKQFNSRVNGVLNILAQEINHLNCHVQLTVTKKVARMSTKVPPQKTQKVSKFFNKESF